MKTTLDPRQLARQGFWIWTACYSVAVAVFLLLGFLPGCATNELGITYNVIIDPSFTPAQAESIADGAHMWSEALQDNVRLNVFVGECNGMHVANRVIDVHRQLCIHPSSIASIASLGNVHAWGVTFRYGPNDSADVYLALDQPETRLDQTAAHELGHAMGLEHTQPGTLMCFSASCIDPKPTCDDVKQYLQIRGLDLTWAPWCPASSSFTYEN